MSALLQLVITVRNWFVLPWMSSYRNDPHHFYGRVFTRRHARKVGIVKNIWIGGGLLMLTLGSWPAVLTISLLLTFVSFVVLDETS